MDSFQWNFCMYDYHSEALHILILRASNWYHPRNHLLRPCRHQRIYALVHVRAR
jgi:hypothetical protein